MRQEWKRMTLGGSIGRKLAGELRESERKFHIFRSGGRKPRVSRLSHSLFLSLSHFLFAASRYLLIKRQTFLSLFVKLKIQRLQVTNRYPKSLFVSVCTMQ